MLEEQSEIEVACSPGQVVPDRGRHKSVDLSVCQWKNRMDPFRLDVSMGESYSIMKLRIMPYPLVALA